MIVLRVIELVRLSGLEAGLVDDHAPGIDDFDAEVTHLVGLYSLRAPDSPATAELEGYARDFSILEIPDVLHSGRSGRFELRPEEEATDVGREFRTDRLGGAIDDGARDRTRSGTHSAPQDPILLWCGRRSRIGLRRLLHRFLPLDVGNQAIRAGRCFYS